MTHMLFFGYGFCAAALAPDLAARGWQLSATCRDGEKAEFLKAQNITPILLDGTALTPPQLSGVTHILLSAAPVVSEAGATQDPALLLLEPALYDMSPAARPVWMGYLSTTGVYGDHDGAWIDEETKPGPVGARGQRRVDAEAMWHELAARLDVAMHYFRLAGIYGPGRNQLSSLKKGMARRVDKPGQVFSRIHVDDIAQILMASIERPDAGRAYSVCDDAPAPPQEVVAFAAALLGLDPPPLVAFEAADLSPMAQSFYGDNKRIKNQRIKTELGVRLKYPDYRAGLTALFEAGAF
jgi:nucleoside-diphosphate-sugar epimerase